MNHRPTPVCSISEQAELMACFDACLLYEAGWRQLDDPYPR